MVLTNCCRKHVFYKLTVHSLKSRIPTSLHGIEHELLCKTVFFLPLNIGHGRETIDTFT